MRIALLMFLLTGAMAGHAQRKPLFTDAEKLEACAVDLPLTYAKKDKERCIQAARFLEDQELIYAIRDKATGRMNCTRVFVVVEKAADGAEYVYVEEAAQRMRPDGLKQAWFPKFKASSERFYNANCFDAQLAAHPELKEQLVEMATEGPK
jgi:hypothetical protein